MFLLLLKTKSKSNYGQFHDILCWTIDSVFYWSVPQFHPQFRDRGNRRADSQNENTGSRKSSPLSPETPVQLLVKVLLLERLNTKHKEYNEQSLTGWLQNFMKCILLKVKMLNFWWSHHVELNHQPAWGQTIKNSLHANWMLNPQLLRYFAWTNVDSQGESIKKLSKFRLTQKKVHECIRIQTAKGLGPLFEFIKHCLMEISVGFN